MAWSRRARGAASSTTSEIVRAPRSCARPSSETRISAVASASGSARWHGAVDAPKKCASRLSEKRSLRPCSSRLREPDRVDDRRGEAPAREALELVLEEGDVEARVVRDEHGVARELEEAADGDLRARRAAQVLVPDPRQRGDVRRQEDAGIHERLERVRDREPAYADGADLADPARARREPGRLEVEDDELGVLDLDSAVRLDREADARAEPREPRVALDDVLEQRARERGRRPLEREEDARRLLRADRAAAGLHELHEPIRGVERELHGPRGYRTYVRSSRALETFAATGPEAGSAGREA